jgi:hypothetical protein
MTIQVAEMALSVNAPPASVLQVSMLSLAVVGNAPSLTGTVLVNGTESANARGGDVVTMNITIDQAYTSVAWTLDPTSAPAEMAGTDTSRQFVAPYLLDGADVLIAVTATGPGGTSAPLMLAVTVYPHADWYADATGTWQPLRTNTDL